MKEDATKVKADRYWPTESSRNAGYYAMPVTKPSFNATANALPSTPIDLKASGLSLGSSALRVPASLVDLYSAKGKSRPAIALASIRIATAAVDVMSCLVREEQPQALQSSATYPLSTAASGTLFAVGMGFGFVSVVSQEREAEDEMTSDKAPNRFVLAGASIELAAKTGFLVAHLMGRPLEASVIATLAGHLPHVAAKAASLALSARKTMTAGSDTIKLLGDFGVDDDESPSPTRYGPAPF